MAYTTPRTWTTDEMITATMLNEQLRDNIAYLYNQFDTATGHDHDGADSKAVSFAGLATATFTTWLPGALAAPLTAENSGGYAALAHPAGYAVGPSNAAYEMMVPFPIPASWAGRAVHVKTITFYGYTSGNSVYFDAIYLRRSDLDGTYTDDVSYTTDIGNGSSGDVSAEIYADDLALSDYPYTLVIKCAGGAALDLRVYGIRVTWEAPAA